MTGLPSQSPNPLLQAATAQAPLTQLGVALGSTQAMPQAPQLATAPPRATSQPLPALASQSPKPGLQAIWQAPSAQEAAPLVASQALPQAAQCSASLARFTSHPSTRLLLQSAKPGLQAIWQAPSAQEAAPLLPLQTLPQAPQWVTLLARSTSQPVTTWPSQSALPALHEPMAQAPLTHAEVAPGRLHALPQAPQLATEVRSTSQPFCGLPSQSAKPGPQAMPHTPLLHAGAPLAPPQMVPHTPQLLMSPLTLTSQPSPTLALQLAKPALQAMPQTPLVQLAVPLVPLQLAPQAPQWSGSAPRLTSQPLAGSLSQSA